MDILSSNNVEIALIQHRLLNCNAELNIKTKPEMGGNLVITSEIKTPTSPSVLKKDDLFSINLFLDITGKLKDSKDTAFSVSCKFEGKYRVINCEKDGLVTKENSKLWSLAVGQLQPLVSQFTTDLAFKMGLKNITVPPVIAGLYVPLDRPTKIPTKKTKKTKTIPA